MFYQIGDDESASRSFIKNLTFVNPSMHISFQSFRIKADAMLAYQLVGADLENVHSSAPKQQLTSPSATHIPTHISAVSLPA